MGFWNSVQRAVLPHCNDCGMVAYHTAAETPHFMQKTPYGKGGKKILIIAPPREIYDVPYGKKYAKSPEGLEFQAIAEQFIHSVQEDCWVLPACACPPMEKKKGEWVSSGNMKTIGCCRPLIEKFVTENSPAVIIPMGDAAVDMLYSYKRIEKLCCFTAQGLHIPDYDLGTWVAPIMDYDNIRKFNNDENMALTFRNQLRNALACALRPFPAHTNYDDQITVLTEYQDVIDNLQNILKTKPEWFDFDYEANCLKPQYKGASLSSASWAVEDNRAYSAPFEGWGHFSPLQYQAIEKLWRQIMACPHIKKSAHNLHMENSWTSFHLKQPVASWQWDSMVAQHNLDTRKGVKGLKLQVFVRYGFGPYNAAINQFLESTKTDHLNRIEEGPKMQILHYGGLDSLFGRKLRQDQMRELHIDSPRPYGPKDAWLDIYQPATETMSDMSLTGFRIDEDYYKKYQKELTAELHAIEKEIMATPETIEFCKRTGKTFNIGSDAELRTILFGILNYTSTRTTKTGASSVDAQALEEIELPLVQKILQWRKTDKILDFIKQYLFEACDGMLYPNYNMHVAESGRSSSSNPNWQNVPKHDKRAKGILRGGIFPHLGYHMGEIDYGSHEIRIYTCHTKDPVLVDYLVHGGDMHIDEAMHLYEVDKAQVSKPMRQNMKMGWNFALLYGSYYKACALKMWEDMFVGNVMLKDPASPDTTGISVAQHMKNKGVRKIDDFIEWCKVKEREFWDKFNVSYEYKQKVIAEYHKKGYVETKFGFRRVGWMNNNMLSNTPTQGSAFHCLVWSANRVRDIAMKEKWQSKQMGQVHDSIIPAMHPTEIQHVLDTYERVMTKDIRERYEWLIVPLEVEMEIGPVDGNWNSLREWTKQNGVWMQKAA